MDATTAARQVFNKLNSGNPIKRRIAVFVKGNNEILMTAPTTSLFHEAMEKRPRDLAGVYDQSARFEMIQSDLVDMGMQK